MPSRLEKESAQVAGVSSTVLRPGATLAFNENEKRDGELKPSDGICDWCRNYPGDIFCDDWPICFGCLEIMIDRENALAKNPTFRNKEYFEALWPTEWK